jgi:hypothetical protein
MKKYRIAAIQGDGIRLVVKVNFLITRTLQTPLCTSIREFAGLAHLTARILIETRASSRLIPKSRTRRGVLLLQIDGIAGVTRPVTGRFAGLCRRTRDA